MRPMEPLAARGPTPWALSVTAVAVPGVLAFFIPVLADIRLGDGEPAAWLANALHAWLACLAVVAALAVLGGYWLPRRARSSSRRQTRDVDEFADLGLLGTAWPVMAVMTVWLIAGWGGDPPWLVWLTGASATVGLAAQVHLLAGALAQTRRPRRDQRASVAKKCKRR